MKCLLFFNLLNFLLDFYMTVHNSQIKMANQRGSQEYCIYSNDPHGRGVGLDGL